jgi:hypothetical protein
VEEEGEEIEDDEQAGEGFLAMAEIVFQIVAVVFEDVEALVFDFPSGSSAGDQFGDIFPGDRQVGDEAVAIGAPLLPPSAFITVYQHFHIAGNSFDWFCRSARRSSAGRPRISASMA